MKRTGDEIRDAEAPDTKRLRPVPLPLLVAQWPLLPTEVQQMEILGRVSVLDLLAFAQAERAAGALVEREFKHRALVMFRSPVREGKPLLKLYTDAEREYGVTALRGCGNDIKYRMLYVYCIQQIARIRRDTGPTVRYDHWLGPVAGSMDERAGYTDIFRFGASPHQPRPDKTLRTLAESPYERVSDLACGWEITRSDMLHVGITTTDATRELGFAARPSELVLLEQRNGTVPPSWAPRVELRDLAWTDDGMLEDGGTAVLCNAAGDAVARGTLSRVRPPMRGNNYCALYVHLHEWDIDAVRDASIAHAQHALAQTTFPDIVRTTITRANDDDPAAAAITIEAPILRQPSLSENMSS